MDRMNELAQRDFAHIWHPCCQMKDYETLPSIVIDHGEGAYLYDVRNIFSVVRFQFSFDKNILPYDFSIFFHDKIKLLNKIYILP